MRSSKIQPFLKWPGGKRWAAETITRIILKHLAGTYYEPFLGGGAVFFQLLPPKAVLSDINSDLVLTYKTIQSDYEAVIEKVRAMTVSKDEYYRIRVMAARSAITKTAPRCEIRVGPRQGSKFTMGRIKEMLPKDLTISFLF
jgi:site-specific DNA-adenine methylase